MSCHSLRLGGRIGGSLLISALVLLVSLTVSSVAEESVNTRCDPSQYYYQLLEGDSDANEWSREDLEELLRTTHYEVTPFYGSRPGVGDVLQALMQLDGEAHQTIHLFYSNMFAARYPIDGSGWVPEHIYPIFMSTVVPSDFDAAFSDLHNIRAEHPMLHESNRGSLYFGICPTCVELFQPGSGTCICEDFFQPPESARGVVARDMLYMQLRYPDLGFSNCHLEQLLAWHDHYPPTQDEIDRNGLICMNWQGNRNPFIDFPELAWSINIQETACAEGAEHYADFEGNNQGDTSHNVLGSIPEFDVKAGDGVLEDAVLEFDTEDKDKEEQSDGDGASQLEMWENIFIAHEQDPQEVDDCANMLPGDINFYVMQASPSRIGFIPLVDVPAGFTMYVTDTLSFASTTMVRIANDIPKPPMLSLTLEETMLRGTPFGHGRNFQLGYDWKVVTEPVMVRGKAIGGDELFLFCYDNNDNLKLISALTTNGFFRDTVPSEFMLQQKGYGHVILPQPMDYYVYNGPQYAGTDQYQKALMDPFNWLGFDLTSQPDGSSSSSQSSMNVGDKEETNIIFAANPTSSATTTWSSIRGLSLLLLSQSLAMAVII